MRDETWAVVPLKSPDVAKSRLHAALDGRARRQLVFAMAQQVIHVLSATPRIAGVAVVTASPEVAAFAVRNRAKVIAQHHDCGMAQACRDAVAALSGLAARVLMISGDLPLLSPDGVMDVIGSDQPSHSVTIVPDRRREGTNALLCAPPAAIAPCFGVDSFQRHIAAARAAGIEPCIVESPELALDIDQPEDLDELRHRLDAKPLLLSAELRAAVLGVEEMLAP